MGTDSTTIRFSYDFKQEIERLELKVLEREVNHWRWLAYGATAVVLAALIASLM